MSRSRSRTRLPVRLETTVLKKITENACAMRKNQPCSNATHQKSARESASGCTLTLSWLPWSTATTPLPATTTRRSLWQHVPRLSLLRQQLKTKINFLRKCGLSWRQQWPKPKRRVMPAIMSKAQERNLRKGCPLQPLQLWKILLKISAQIRLRWPQTRLSFTDTKQIDSYK